MNQSHLRQIIFLFFSLFMPFILPTSQAKEGRQRVVRESAFSQRERLARPIEEQEEVVRKDKKGNNKIIIFVGLTILGLCLPALAVGGIAFFTKKTPKKHSKKSLKELLEAINTLTPAQIEKIIEDPDTPLQDQKTALHIAASENNVEAIEALIDKNANINALDSFKQTHSIRQQKQAT